MDGKTTFYQEFQRALGEYYRFSKVFRPYLLPEEFKANIADLEAAIGNTELDNSFKTALENPVGIAALFASVMAMLSLLVPDRTIPTQFGSKMSRREFLLEGLGGGVLVGGLGGIILSTRQYSQLTHLVRNALYLDNTYTRIFNTPNETSEYKYDRRGFFAALVGQPT